MMKMSDAIVQRVGEFILEHGMLEKRDRLLLSLSAGKDSMALLDIMCKLAGQMSLTLGVFHLNHLARGADSDGDEAFVTDLAGLKGIRLYAERLDCTMRPRGKSFEEYSRERRYEMLAGIARSDSWTRIATAHTLSDNSETVLMRILRGTGIHGLRGIDPIRGIFIRPLLGLNSEEIYAYLRENELEWREDGSNADSRFLRNFIRNELLPFTARRFGAAEEALNRLSVLATENQLLIGRLLAKAYGKTFTVEDGRVVIRPEELDNDESIIRHALITAIRDHFGMYISRAIIEEALRAYRSCKSTLTVKAGSDLYIHYERVGRGSTICIGHAIGGRSKSPAWKYCVDIIGVSAWPLRLDIAECGISMDISVVEYSRFLEEGRNGPGLFLALPENVDYIILRNRVKGDRIKLGFGTRKIKDLMIDLKIPARLRDSIPIVEANGKTAGVMTGFMPGATNRVGVDFMITEKSQKILAIYRAGGINGFNDPPGITAGNASNTARSNNYR